VLALTLGGVVTWTQRGVVQQQPQSTVTALVKSATTAPATEGVVTKQNEDSTDPWQSDELKEFGSMVEWESWVESGDQSL
jgi:hypothetical protein